MQRGWVLLILVVSSLAWAQHEPRLAVSPSPRLPAIDKPPARALPPRDNEIKLSGLPDELIEGREVTIGFECGRDIISTEIVGWSEGATLAGEQVSGSVVVIRDAERQVSGQTRWTPPLLDTIGFTLKVRGYGADGRLKATAVRWLPYRPAALSDKHEDGIYIWLSHEGAQRLFLQRDGRLVRCLYCSGGEGNNVVSAGSHPGYPHDHYGVFNVYSKSVDHYSSINPAWRMRYAMHYLAGHAIHATAPQMYPYLGEPASHGCIRLHLIDAEDLFDRCEVGTRVEIF